MDYSVAEVHDILVNYTVEAGESIFEELDGVFEGQKVLDYWKFLLDRKLLTEKQYNECLVMYKTAQDGTLEPFDLTDVENIEMLTCTSKWDSLRYSELKFDEKYGSSNPTPLDLESAGLILTPLVFHGEDVGDYNEFYWDAVLGLIAEYLITDDIYAPIIASWEETVQYYFG